MTVMSNADINRIANAKRVECFPTLNLAPLVEVASATVAANATRPISQLSVSGTSGWSDIVVGTAFRVESSSGVVKAWGVVRKTPTASVFYPDAKSAGDFGYATDTGRAIVTGDVLRVYQHKPAQSLMSRIGPDEMIYKAWDRQYTNEGIYPAPICNIGQHRQVFIDVGDTASMVFDASRSFDWFSDLAHGRGGDNGIAVYHWHLPSKSVSILSGTVNDPQITLAVDPGEAFEIGQTVTSINGKSTTGWRWVFPNVNDPENAYAPFSQQYTVREMSGRTDYRGTELTVTIVGDVSSELYPGQMCLLKDVVLYDGTAIIGALDTLVGYLDEYSIESIRGDLRTTLIFRSALKIAKSLPIATQLIAEKTSPADWTEVRVGLSDPAFATYYILKYHTTILETCDYSFNTTYRTLRRQAWGFKQNTIESALKTIEDIAVGLITQDYDGEIRLIYEPNHLTDARRDVLDVTFNWTDFHLRGPLRLQPNLRPPVGEIVMGALAHDGSNEPPAYRSAAPGNAQPQAPGSQALGDISVTVQGGAAELYRVIGHRWAYLNNPLQALELLPAAMLDILNPASSDWHSLSVPDRYLPIAASLFGIDWSDDRRFRPVIVTRRWEYNKGWTKTLGSTVRTESKGQPGVYRPIDRNGAQGYIGFDGWLDNLDLPALPEMNLELDLPSGFATAIVHNSAGQIASSFNFLDAIVNFGSIKGFINGAVIDACWDFLGSGVYVLSWSEVLEELYVYHTSDPLSAFPAWTLENSFSNVTGFYGMGRIVSSASLVFVSWKTETAVKGARRDSGGWAAAENVGPLSTTDEEGARLPHAIAIDDNTVYAAARGSNGGYSVVRATGKAGAWFNVPNQPGDNTESDDAITMLHKGSTLLFVTYGLNTEAPGTITPGLDQYYQTIPPQSEPLYIESGSAGTVNTSVYYGSARLWSMDGPAADYAVTELAVTGAARIWYRATQADPPGVAGTPQYFPPSPESSWRVEMTIRVTLFNSKLEPLWVSAPMQYHNMDSSLPYSILYAPSTLDFTRVRFSVTPTWTISFPTAIQGVRFIQITSISDTPHNFGTGIITDDGLTFPRVTILSPSLTITADNKIERGRRLYTVDATDTWTDITPYGGEQAFYERTPELHNALTTYNNDIVAVVTDPNGTRTLVSSSNNGSTWAEVETATSLQWVKALGSAQRLVAGGTAKLILTDDAFATTVDRLGDWAASVGSPDTIRDCLVLMENP